MRRFDNIQKYLTPELLSKMIGEASFDCEECPAKEDCSSDTTCENNILKWLQKEE